MFRRMKFQLPIAWAVLFAVLFNIALPSLASVRVGNSLPLGEICTSSGTKKITQPGVEPAPAEHASLLHDGHCQLCPVGAAAGPVPATPVVLPITVELPRAWAPPPPVPLGQRKGCAPPPSHAPPVIS